MYKLNLHVCKYTYMNNKFLSLFHFTLGTPPARMSLTWHSSMTSPSCRTIGENNINEIKK